MSNLDVTDTIPCFTVSDQLTPHILSWIADEKNERTKESIRKKCTEYIERAEALKDVINKQQKKKKAVPLGGSNGGRELNPVQCHVKL